VCGKDVSKASGDAGCAAGDVRACDWEGRDGGGTGGEVLLGAWL